MYLVYFFFVCHEVHWFIYCHTYQCVILNCLIFLFVEGTPYLIPSGDMHSYLSQDEDRGIPHSVKDTRSIGSAYDRYLQSMV